LASTDYNIELILTAQDNISKALKKVNAELNKMKKKSNSAGASVKKANNSMWKSFDKLKGQLIAVFAVKAVVNFWKEMLSVGTNLDLMWKKADVVLWKFRGDVEATAQDVARSMGMTNMQFVTATTNMADLLVPMKFTREEAVKMATETTKLAGALSEWSAGKYTAAEASEIMAKAMLGETEQLKQMGIKIDQSSPLFNARIKQIMETTGVTLEQARAMDIQQQIFDKSTDAQAAYADWAWSAARRQAELSASMQELKERLAVALLPAFERLVEIWLKVASVIEKLTWWGNALHQEVKKIDKEYVELNWELSVHKSALEKSELATKNLKNQKERGIITEIAYNKATGEATNTIVTETRAIIQNTKVVIRNRIEKLKSLQAEYEELQKVDEKTLELWGDVQWQWQIMNVAYAQIKQKLWEVTAEMWGYWMQVAEAELTLKNLWVAWVEAYDWISEAAEDVVTATGNIEKATETTFKDFGTDVENVVKNMLELQQEVVDLQTALNNLWVSETEDVAKRYIEAQAEMAKIKEQLWDTGTSDDDKIKLLQEQKHLQEEIAIAFRWLSEEQSALLEEQIAEQERYNALTGIEKIREDYAEKRLAIEDELNAKIEALNTEADKLQELMSSKQALEKAWMLQLANDQKVQVDWYNAQIALARTLAKARASLSKWGGSSWWGVSWARADGWPVSRGSTYLVGERWPELFVPNSSWTIVPNNETTNNNWVSISVASLVVREEADIWLIAAELARQIELDRLYNIK